MRYAFSLLLSVLFSSQAFGAAFTMTTENGKSFRLESSEPRITTKTNQLLLCGDSIAAVNFVKLWMPNHGHGSSPVKLSEVGGQCRAITRVNFTMSGSWDVIVKLKDGDQGMFQVPVSRR